MAVYSKAEMKNGYPLIRGYIVKLGVLTFPVAPESIEISVGSKNETVDLINEGEINIPAPPALVEISFTARFPMRPYPWAPVVNEFQTYYDLLKNLKENKIPANFTVQRMTPAGKSTWDTDILVLLEDFKIQESVDNGDDVLIDINLKQYRSYSTKTKIVKNDEIVQPTLPPEPTREVPEQPAQQTYTVTDNDTLWGIAKQFYGNGAQWGRIYDANKDAIEADARNHGYQSSSNGHWIWAGLQLVIPN